MGKKQTFVVWMKKIVGSQIDVWTFEALSVSVKFLDLMVKIGLSLQIWNLVVYLSVCICHDNNPHHDDDEGDETEVKPVKPFHPRSVTPPLSSTFHLSPSRLPCCISFIFVIMKYWQTSKDENKSRSLLLCPPPFTILLSIVTIKPLGETILIINLLKIRDFIRSRNSLRAMHSWCCCSSVSLCCFVIWRFIKGDQRRWM